jgi:hypothetical protein
MFLKRLADVVLAEPRVDRCGIRAGVIEHATNKM